VAALRVNPRIEVLKISSRTGEGLAAFYAWIAAHATQQSNRRRCWHETHAIEPCRSARGRRLRRQLPAPKESRAMNRPDQARPMQQVAIEIRVSGRVQGVGFRPTVWRFARDLELCGEVLNDAHGVLVRVGGCSSAVEDLVVRIRSEPPPLARIDGIETRSLSAICRRDSASPGPSLVVRIPRSRRTPRSARLARRK